MDDDSPTVPPPDPDYDHYPVTMDDWQPFDPNDQAVTPPDFEIPQAAEGYRSDLPANFKWGVNGETGQLEIWQVTGGTDGRPFHRSHLEEVWGRPVSLMKSGDVMGLGLYKPGTWTLRGQLTEPACVTLQTYYDKPTPQSVIEWFQTTYPNAEISEGELTPKRGAALDWNPYEDPGFEVDGRPGRYAWAIHRDGNVMISSEGGSHEQLEQHYGVPIGYGTSKALGQIYNGRPYQYGDGSQDPDIHEQVMDAFKRQGPLPGSYVNHVNRRSKTADWSPEQQTEEVFKWVWNQAEGTLYWHCVDGRKPDHDDMIVQEWHREPSAKDWRGAAFLVGDEFVIQPYRFETPAEAMADVKQRLAQDYPSATFDSGDIQKDHEALGVEFIPGIDKAGAVGAAWANLTFAHTPQTPLEGPESHVEATETPSPRTTSFSVLRERLRRKKRSAKEADMDGCMVALFLPEEVGKKLLRKNGEPLEQLHVTLAYFEDDATSRDDWEGAEAIVKEWADKTEALSGKIGGYGVFQNEDGDILWASPSIPGLDVLRTGLVEDLNKAGFKVSDEHGFVPHVTLQYGFEGSLPKLKSKPNTFYKALTFAQGENKKDFPFGKGHKTSGWEDWYSAERAIPFVTDGKEVKFDTDADLFKKLFPESDPAKLISGEVIPTSDGEGYGVRTESTLHKDSPGAHEVIGVLDASLGQPCHYL